MSQRALFLTVKKIFGGVKIKRYMDGGDWVTDGMVAIKKEYEPKRYAKLRFTSDLSDSGKQSLAKILADYATQPKVRLFLPEIIKIDPQYYAPTKLFSPSYLLPLTSKELEVGGKQRAVVNGQYLALLADNVWFMRIVDTLEFWQATGNNINPIFITTADGEHPIAILMPMAIDSAEVAIYDN